MSDKMPEEIGRDSPDAPTIVSLLIGVVCGVIALPGTITLLSGQTVTTNIREILFLIALWGVFLIAGVPALRTYYHRLRGKQSNSGSG
jgi:hypothetical protein